MTLASIDQGIIGASARPERAPALADYAGWSTPDVLRDLLCRVFPRRIVLVSSFGIESAVLLHLLSRIDRAAPVIFLETGKLFPETVQHRDALVDRLGLSDVRSVGPDAATLASADPAGILWRSDPDMCCWHRKVEPLDGALASFPAWITGRKRFQGGTRGALPLIEHDGGRVKVNALASWSAEQVGQYVAEHGLPRHPLEAQGYRSLGCTPCTRPTAQGDDPRAGRWAGRQKTECGIHLPHAPTSNPRNAAPPLTALTETSSHA